MMSGASDFSAAAIASSVLASAGFAPLMRSMYFTRSAAARVSHFPAFASTTTTAFVFPSSTIFSTS